MKKPVSTPTRAEAQDRLTRASDLLGAELPAHYLASLADEALAQADRIRENIAVNAAAANWFGGSPDGVAASRLDSLVGQFSDQLGVVIVSQILESSPEVASAREIVRPLIAERDRAKAELAALDEAASLARQRLETEITRAREAALQSPEVIALQRELEAIS